MNMSLQRLGRIIWRWFLTFAVVSIVVNFSYNGVRCLQEKIPSCNRELQEQAELRYQALLALKNANKIQTKTEQHFWLTIMSLSDNEVIVDVD